MPGNLCKGDNENCKLKESKAFCEGLAYATGGGLIGDNPHPAGSADAAAWDQGHNAYQGGVGTPIQVCCAEPAYDGVP